MYGHREKTSKFFRSLAYGPDRKRNPATILQSVSPRSPAPQTSLIFELPNELILSILSYICPDPQLTSHYARFRLSYNVGISDCYNRRVQFLRPLSMTCRAMRLRLLPWVWERVDLSPARPWTPEGWIVQRFKAVANVVCVDTRLAMNVKFMKVHLPLHWYLLSLFVKCLESLPNLHTLEVGKWAQDMTTTPLEKALKGVELPQIKTLIIPPSAHPLLRHCYNVEDVVCAVNDQTTPSSDFLGSLASNQISKVERLAIPLPLWPNPTKLVAVCPRLTELTICHINVKGILPKGQDGTMRSEISELVVACEALIYFNTLQILYFLEQSLREKAKRMKDLAIECLRGSKTGNRQGEERKTTVRLVMLNPARPGPDCHPGFVEVEEYEV